ncbi:MAG: hypothetical protein L0Y54_07820 [Sporichthyaceae bacterium]|nr:hypothetical protein [Sporichthyaceae bacterium]
MAFVTVAEFAAYLRTTFDAEETVTAQQLLDDATADIETEAGQPLQQSIDTVTMDGSGTHKLVLPRWPVTAVTSVKVTEDDGEVKTLVFDDDYTWSASGILTRKTALWPCGDRSVEAVVTAGYAVISTDLKRICRRLAVAAWENPAGADSEDLGDRRVRWHTAGAELSESEKRTIARYAR